MLSVVVLFSFSLECQQMSFTVEKLKENMIDCMQSNRNGHNDTVSWSTQLQKGKSLTQEKISQMSEELRTPQGECSVQSAVVSGCA